jgi:hypothetical protein
VSTPAGPGDGSSPLDFVRRFINSAVNFHVLWQKTGVPPGVQHTTPAETPITDGQLPQDVRALVDQYRASHPGANVTWLKRMQAVDGNLRVVVEDERPVPAETALLTVSRTISINTSDTANAVTDVFVGRLG